MTGFEAILIFYAFVNLMNLDNMFDERDMRIDQLESQIEQMQTE